MPGHPSSNVDQVDMVNELSIRRNVLAEWDELMESYGRREMDLMDFRMAYNVQLETEAIRRGLQGYRPDDVYDEECARIDKIHHPTAKFAANNGAPLVVVAGVAAKTRIVRRFVKAKLECSNPFFDSSRDCVVCYAKRPMNRVFFAACRHVICLRCDEKLEQHSSKDWANSCCPFCGVRSECTMLDGEPIAVNPQNPPNPPYPRTPHPDNIKPELTSRQHIIRSFLSGEIDDQKYQMEYGYRLQLEASMRGGFVYCAEFRRFGSSCPCDSSFSTEILCEMAADAAAAFVYNQAAEKLRLIAQLKTETESIASTRQYSRACDICCMETPRQRSVFTACGHSICRACGETLAMEAMQISIEKKAVCPYCRTESDTVTLAEEWMGGGVILEKNSALDESEMNKQLEEEYGPEILTNHLIRYIIIRRKLLIRSFLDGEVHEHNYVARYTANLEVEEKHRPEANVVDEEYHRLENFLPQGASRLKLAASAADAERRRRKMALIGQLQAENERNASSSLECTRSCLHCTTNEPSQRSVFTACGHVICRACTEQLTMNADDPEHIECPICFKKSKTVTLFENFTEKKIDREEEKKVMAVDKPRRSERIRKIQECKNAIPDSTVKKFKRT